MLEFRPLAPSDLPVIHAIECQAHRWPWTEGMLASCLGERYVNRLALWQGQPVGFFIADYLAGESTLMNLCLLPACRGRGWGRALLRHYLALTRALGCECWWLEVRDSNRVALNLYLSAGYRQVGLRQGYYGAGAEREDARVLQRLAELGERP